SKKNPLVVVLDNVRSQHNIGSVFRTSDAFLIEAVYLCGISATPPNKEMHKTALGAEMVINWKYREETLDAIDELKKAGYTILSIEQADGSKTLQDYEIFPDKKYALVFGHEIKGVSQEVVNASDDCIEIEQHGTKHSLNISVSAGIVIWEFYKVLMAKKKERST
ncbi:MAG: RNA methyltransferase, partial [bacterium]